MQMIFWPGPVVLWTCVLGQVENTDIADITDFFSNFYKSVFSIFTYSEYRKLGFKKIQDFQTSMFSMFTYIW